MATKSPQGTPHKPRSAGRPTWRRMYILNKKVATHKRIKNALTSIYGVREKRALEIAHSLCINPNLRFNKVFRSPSQIAHGASLITAHLRSLTKSAARGPKLVGSSLQKKKNEDVKRLTKIRCYRGIRHRNKLPVRGQRTHTNAQTQKKMSRIK